LNAFVSLHNFFSTKTKKEYGFKYKINILKLKEKLFKSKSKTFWVQK